MNGNYYRSGMRVGEFFQFSQRSAILTAVNVAIFCIALYVSLRPRQGYVFSTKTRECG